MTAGPPVDRMGVLAPRQLRRLAGPLVAAGLAIAGCNSGSPLQLQPPVAIDGVRTEGERGLLLTFVGSSPELPPSDPCWTGYRPDVAQLADRVVMTIRSVPSTEGPPGTGFCTSAGFFRAMVVELAEPLGDRALVDGATRRERRPFDGATLRRPGFLPSGFGLLHEGPGADEPEPSTRWVRTWGPARVPPQDGRCADIVSPVVLSQGPVSAGRAPGEPVTVRGLPGVVVRDPRAGQATLSWLEGGQELVLGSTPPCEGTPPADLDLLLQFAEGLT